MDEKRQSSPRSTQGVPPGCAQPSDEDLAGLQRPVRSWQYLRAPRTRAGLSFVVIGLLVFAMLSSGAGVWAASGPSPRRGTVPTPTPRVQPTKPPAPPSGPPTPTRGVPPTRTPCINCSAHAAVAESAVPVDVLINAGGGEYTDSAGRVWQADQEYVQGLTEWGYVLGDAESGTFAGEQPISGTPDSPLYQDERWAMSGYRVELPDGTYAVTLKFAEQFLKAKGERVFSVKMQDVVVLKDLDLLGEAGAMFTAMDKTITVTVSNRLLSIDFLPLIENPTVAGIAVHPILPPTPTPASTGTPEPTETATPTQKLKPTATETGTETPTPLPTATALPSTSRIVALFPEMEAALRSPDGAVLARLPAHAVESPMAIVYLAEDRLELPHANPGFRLGSVAFSLQPVDAAGAIITQTLVQQPISLTVRYSAADVEAAAHEYSRLVLANYRSEEQQWVAVDTVNDPVNGSVAGRTRRLGMYAIMVRALPSLSVGDTELVSTGSLVAGGLALLVVGIVLGFGLRGTGGRKPGS